MVDDAHSTSAAVETVIRQQCRTDLRHRYMDDVFYAQNVPLLRLRSRIFAEETNSFVVCQRRPKRKLLFAHDTICRQPI